MRYCIPALFAAFPAFAHPTALPHGHSVDWAVPVALALIGVAAIAAKSQKAKARARK